MSFVPTVAGPHDLVLRGSVVDGGFETSCADDVLTINVTDPQANVASFRFRFLPAPGQPAPAQERTFEIYGGADRSWTASAGQRGRGFRDGAG
jgi:hypothetical protein